MQSQEIGEMHTRQLIKSTILEVITSLKTVTIEQTPRKTLR